MQRRDALPHDHFAPDAVLPSTSSLHHAQTSGGAPLPAVRSDYGFLVGRLIDAKTLQQAEMLAARWGVRPHEVLIANGWISAEDYLRAAADFCGVKFWPEAALGAAKPAGAERTAQACLKAGMLTADGSAIFAPIHVDPSSLRQALLQINRRRVGFAVPDSIRRVIYRHFAGAISFEAKDGLDVRAPEKSAKTALCGWQWLAAIGLPAAFGLALLQDPALTIRISSLALAVLFVPVIGIRLAALWGLRHAVPSQRKRARQAALRLREDSLPVYTILVLLLREGRVVGRLTQPSSTSSYCWRRPTGRR